MNDWARVRAVCRRSYIIGRFGVLFMADSAPECAQRVDADKARPLCQCLFVSSVTFVADALLLRRRHDGMFGSSGRVAFTLPLETEGEGSSSDKRVFVLSRGSMNMAVRNMPRTRPYIGGGVCNQPMSDQNCPDMGVLHPRRRFISKNPSAR